MPLTSPSLQTHRDLPPPAQLARELSHLPGLVFLDHAGSENGDDTSTRSRFSLITANPSRLHQGNLFCEADFARLRSAYLEKLLPSSETPDFGFPLSGFYGYVEYEGDFLFGEYEACLIYDHESGQWHELGSLSEAREPIQAADQNPQCDFVQNTSESTFCEMVKQAQAYIAAGDIYQVNLAHRLEAQLDAHFDPFTLYHQLRDQSPAPFAAYLDLCSRQIISSSPEQFLSISGKTIQTRPIKGTRPRFRDRHEDERSAYDLITSPKEVAELIMITDLERNDLGQICEFGSVEATELLKLERFAQVFHLVSTVEGTLRSDVDAVTALHQCFPGGSITGAPKKRAREIIEELESEKRGLYTGAIGCFGFNGESRFNIAIRTAICENETIHFHVGAGIVADSDPQKEWEETLHKAAGILQACSE